MFEIVGKYNTAKVCADIVEISDSFRKFVERRHSVVIAWNIDYNIWEW